MVEGKIFNKKNKNVFIKYYILFSFIYIMEKIVFEKDDFYGDILFNKIYSYISNYLKNKPTLILDIHNTIEHLTEENAFKNLAITLKNAKNVSYSIDKVSKNLSEGKGTLGKLLVDDGTYLRITAILSKIDTLMNDVNQYGVFFNLNKQWQRTRIQKVSMLNALNTPESFKEYFSNEVDLISTSMARLSMLVEKADQDPDRDRIFDNKTFQRDFAELMRRSQTLYENLRLYNEQLIQAQKTGLNNCN